MSQLKVDSITDEAGTGAPNFPNGASVAGNNLPTGGPLAGFRNAIMNGDFRINQRNFNGDWSGLSDGDYGFDRWKRQDASTIRQVIEAGNFEPDTVHTLSGTNITTTQITSPSSGNWNIDVPNNASRVQLEQGTVATPFERRPIGTELALCQRYFEIGAARHWSASASADAGYSIRFATTKRAIPSVILSDAQSSNASNVRAEGVTAEKFDFLATGNGVGAIFFAVAFAADAEL